MHRIDIKAVVLAFLAEICVDLLVMNVLLMFFGSESITSGMSEAEAQAAIEAVIARGDYQLAAFVCGMATTILGGYFAARLAKDFPYYNGLAIGVVGVVFVLVFAGDNPLWFTIIGVLLTIPASIYGAHFAAKHRPTPPGQR